MIEIVEVLRRSEQGKTEPFICRGDDGEFYFVKGMGGAGHRSLVCEWICGQLGRAIGLPIAPFEIVNVPRELTEIDSPLNLRDLGPGSAFGSRQQQVTEITIDAIPEVPAQLRQDVLLFDWWIKNGDRMLTAYGGNPNLFWEPSLRELVVIDHNIALEAELEFNDFIELHIFNDDAKDTFGDFVNRQRYTERLSSAMQQWSQICDSLPVEWMHLDPELLDPIDLSLDAVYAMLMRFTDDSFWKWS